MLTENGLDIPMATFQSRKVKEDACGEFEFFTKLAYFANELGMLSYGAMSQVESGNVHAGS